MKISRCALFMLLLVFVLAIPARLSADADTPQNPPRRILFIGNSYTAQIKATFRKLLADSYYKDTEVEFITPGGMTLKRHLSNEQTVGRVKGGAWDMVVLQEQSQTPALPGEYVDSFHQAVETFSGIIKEAGARPVLYMTWGRRDGDAKNQKLFPDYLTMQDKLTTAYREAAVKNNAMLAPVGVAWSSVRKTNPELGEALYKQDGSHPSSKGAYLVSCVLLRTFFKDSLASVKKPEALTLQEQKTIHEAVLGLDLPR